MAEQHHEHGEGTGRSGKAEQGLEEQHGPSPNCVVADALTWSEQSLAVGAAAHKGAEELSPADPGAGAATSVLGCQAFCVTTSFCAWRREIGSRARSGFFIGMRADLGDDEKITATVIGDRAERSGLA